MSGNKFDTFISDLDNIKEVDNLSEAISKLGLSETGHNPLTFENITIYPDNDRLGSWHHPHLIASFLMDMKDVLKSLNITSFLEIGTFSGYNFFVTLNFLRKFVNPNITGKTIDIVDLDTNSDSYQLVLPYFQNCDSNAIANATWDLVIIDGSPDTQWLQTDFDNVKTKSKMVVFMNPQSKWMSFTSPEYQRFKLATTGYDMKLYRTSAKYSFPYVITQSM